MSKCINTLFALFLVTVLLGAGYGINFYYNVTSKTETTVIIPKNTRIRDIATILYDNKLIPETFSFKLIAFLNLKQGKFLQAGEYYFPAGSNVNIIFEKIAKGDQVVRKITIPEGYTNYQIINLLHNTPGLEGELPQAIAEGTLLPETYTFHYGDSRKSIVVQMQDSMQRFMEKEFAVSNNPLLKKPADIVILASIIEKEARITDEQPIIASVYLNRLKIGMPLQADPTVIYALKNGKTDFNYILTRADLTFDSPFNTYKYLSLPPTPICNPGKASINAALHPATTEHLYFVANNYDGRHFFSKSYKEHLARIKQAKVNNG